MDIRIPSDSTGLLQYGIGTRVEAFSTLRDAPLPYPVLQGHQTHDDVVVVVTDREMTRGDLDGVDALVTRLPDFAIGVRTADCVPVLLYDPLCRAVAAVHAGWKGTVKKIAPKTVSVMASEFGTSPSSLLAVIGPSIAPASFQVGQEVADRFLEAGFPPSVVMDKGPRGAAPVPLAPATAAPDVTPMRGGLHIDLWDANRWLLLEAGLAPEHILVAGIDTYVCNDLFFSARREGISCGRIINAIKLK